MNIIQNKDNLVNMVNISKTIRMLAEMNKTAPE